METQLTKRGIMVDASAPAVAVGIALSANHRLEILKPLTFGKWDLFDLFLKEIKFVENQEEIHMLEGWMHNYAFKEFFCSATSYLREIHQHRRMTDHSHSVTHRI